MSIKKVLPVLIVLLGLIPSCCQDIIPFYTPGSLEAEMTVDRTFYSDMEDVEITSTEGLGLWLSFEDVEFVVENKNYFALQNSCYATQPCPEDGDRGLKSVVTSVRIVSSNEFQSIEAGEDISQHFHVLQFLERDDENNPVYTQESISTQLENFNFLIYDESYVEYQFSSLPGNNLVHTFTAELTFEDGTTMSSTTVPVQF